METFAIKALRLCLQMSAIRCGLADDFIRGRSTGDIPFAKTLDGHGGLGPSHECENLISEILSFGAQDLFGMEKERS